MSEELKQTLVVTRDGHLDEEWLHDLIAEQKREVLKHSLRAAGTFTIEYSAIVGRNIVNLLRDHPLQVN